ncbi:hypothetical protein N7501_010235 [Penicillium viridicatum]|nr:hypothetical protein N7501_010235 [Penicillium viridicatum]
MISPCEGYSRPAVALEVGVSGSEMKLRADAQMWVDPSGGQANIAITIKIKQDRPLLKIDKWEWDADIGRPWVFHNIEITGAHGTASVSGEPLLIPFHQIWRRAAQYPRGTSRLQSKSIDRNSHELSEYFVIAIDPFSFKQDLLLCEANSVHLSYYAAQQTLILRMTTTEHSQVIYERQPHRRRKETGATNQNATRLTKADGNGDEIEQTKGQRDGASHWKLMSLPREDELFDSAGEVQ